MILPVSHGGSGQRDGLRWTELRLTEGEVSVNAIALRIYRQVLRERMSPVMGGEALTLSSIIDSLLTGQCALAVDMAVQRLKSLEAIASGASWTVAQRFEVVPSEMAQMASRAGSVHQQAVGA